MAPRRNSILLTVIRCGETTWEADDRLLGSADLPLSDAGRSAVSSIRLAPFTRGTVHHAPDEASTDTATIVAGGHGLRTRVVEDLADPHLGLLEGLTAQVFAERYPKRYKQWQDEPASLSPPEGENLGEARARQLGAVARLLRRSRSNEVSLVLRSLGLGFLRCWLADLSSRELWTTLDRPTRHERYVLTGEMVKWMDEAASAVGAKS